MFKRFFATVLSLGCLVDVAAAQPVASDTVPALPNREIRVPFDALPVLLSGTNQRIFMTRAEYEELIKKANATPEQIRASLEAQLVESKIPVGAIVSDANYTLQIEQGRASIAGVITIEVLKNGLQPIPLDLKNVGIIEATVDGDPAMLSNGTAELPGTVLFLEGKGVHQLTLKLVAAVSAAAAQQTLSLVLPHAASNNWTMTVPGNVELLSGAFVRSRQVDAEKNVTQFSILPNQAADVHAPVTMVMTLNNKMLRDTRLLECRNLIVDEITESFERVRLQLTINVLNGAENKFQVAVPSGFEISDVLSPLLSRWGIVEIPGNEAQVKRVLEIEMREPVTEQIVVQVNAIKPHASPLTETPQAWTWPDWKVLDTESQTAVLSIRLENGLQLRAIDYGTLIPIDSATIDAAIAALPVDPASQPLRTVASLYSPVAEQKLTSQIEKPKSPVTSSLILQTLVSESGVLLKGTIDLQTGNESLASLELETDPAWRIQSAKMEDGTLLPFYVPNGADGKAVANGLARIRFARPIAPKTSARILVEYSHIPTGWLASWTEQSFAFPKLVVRDTELKSTVLSTQAEEDFSLTTPTIEKLLALFDSERRELQIQDLGKGTGHAFSTQGSDWKLSIAVARNKPQVSAEAFSFFRIATEEIKATYELHLDIKQASTDTIEFSLPESAPGEVSIRGIAADTVVKESTSRIVDGRRLWTVKLAKRITGNARLGVDFKLNLDPNNEQSLPNVRVNNTVFQTGVVALEGDDELDISVTKHPNLADVGELTETTYPLGNRLVGVFGYTQVDSDTDVIVIRSVPRKLQTLPTSLVQHMRLDSAVSRNRASYHVASLQLKSIGGFVHAELPADATLWSIIVDGKPSLPQRKGDLLVIELRANSETTPNLPRPVPSNGNGSHSIQITYELPVHSIGLRNQVDLVAPKLATVATESGPSVPIPMADMHWVVWIPDNLKVAAADGDLQLEQSETHRAFPFTCPKYFVEDMNLFSSTLRAVANRALDPFRLEQDVVGGGSDRYRMDEYSYKVDDSPLPKGVSGYTTDVLGDSPAQPQELPPAQPQQVFPAKPQDELTEARKQLDFLRSQLQPDRVAKRTVPNGRTFVTNAVDGLRTLPVQFERPIAWQSFNLKGYGDHPVVGLSVVNEHRLEWIGYALAALIGALSLCVAHWSLAKFLSVGALVMLVLVALPLLSPWPYETGAVAGYCFFAVLAAVSARTLLSLARPVIGRIGRWQRTKATSSIVAMLLVFCALTTTASAQEGKPAAIGSFEELVTMLQGRTNHGNTPLEIPANAILVPSLPNSQVGSPDEKILVPYSVYTALMQLANPNATPKSSPEGPAEYSLANLKYQANLNRDDVLVISMSVDVMVHTDRSILLPFGLADAILTQSKWDNEPATIRMAPNAMVVVAEGKRKHTFEASFHIPIQRQGGWRIVNALLPTAPAGALMLSVPKADTELRMLGLPDVEQRETNEDNQTIESVVSKDGRLNFQWRPKVTENNTDQGMTAITSHQLVLMENGMRGTWDVTLQFRRGRRDQFEFELPAGLIIEKVSGKNVRGWTVISEADKQRIQVTLLKSAIETEQLTIIASQSKRLGLELSDIIAPRLVVPEAMLHQGRLTIFRSSQLELQTQSAKGLVREDIAANDATLATNSPLPSVAFQSYRFNDSDYGLNLKVSDIPLKLDSQAQSNLRVSRNDARLVSSLTFSSKGRPLYRVQVEVPANWKWKPPQSAVPIEWTLSEPTNDVRVFDIRFMQGQTAATSIELNGEQVRELASAAEDYTIALPRVRVLNSASARGTLNVFADAGVDVSPEQLVDCKSSIAGGVGGAARTITYSTNDYSGTLRFKNRTPQISILSISNVKVTRRSLEETIYLEWNIRDAGVHSLEFTLPARLKDATVLAQMVRRIQRVPENAAQADSPIRFQLELQEDVMGQYRVLVQLDSPLPTQNQPVAIPSKLTGTIDSRLVTLENSGRDELVVASKNGITALTRGDAQWVKLSSLLGGKSAEVYRVNDQNQRTAADQASVSEEPQLVFQTQSRSVVETVSARIGLARTVMSVDAAGNYRATQEFRVENTSEAFIEVELPVNAQLWTAYVAGSPVKPIDSPNKPKQSGASRVRLPLIRTQTGDLDYGVELKYAGRLAKPGLTTELKFPLIESININVELSQVKLLLPTEHSWYNFSGTLGQVNDEGDFLAGWLLQKNKQLSRLSEIAANDSESFAKARAEENLKLLNADVKFSLGNSGIDLNTNDNLQKQLAINSSVVQQIAKQEADSMNDVSKSTEPGNRAQFNSLFDSQTNYRANGNVDNQFSGRKSDEKPSSEAGEKDRVEKRNKANKSSDQKETKDATSKASMDNRELARSYKGKLQSQAAPGFRQFNNPNGVLLEDVTRGDANRDVSGQNGQADKVLSNEPSSRSQSGAPAGYGSGMGGVPGNAAGAMGGRRSGPAGPMGGMGGGMGGMGALDSAINSPAVIAIDGRPNNATQDDLFLANPTTSRNEGYLASLDVNFEPRGRVYYFTTPRGDVSLTASGFDKSLYTKAAGLALLLLGVVVTFVVRKFGAA